MDTVLVDSENFLAPESGVVALRGEEVNPQHTNLIEEFKVHEEVRKFAYKYCDDKEDPEGWLDNWLDEKLLSIGGVTPRQAIASGKIDLVMLRVEQNLRSKASS